MPITCNYLDASDVDLPGPFYNDDDVDYSVAPTLRRRKKCASCKSVINPGDTITSHPLYTFPRTDVEARIMGGGYEDWEAEIPLAPVEICEECSDLYFSFVEKGFAVFPHENQHDNLIHYHDYVYLTGKETCREGKNHV